MLTILIIEKYPIMCVGLRFFLSGRFPDVRLESIGSVTELESIPKDFLPELVIVGADRKDSVRASQNVIKKVKRAFSMAAIILYDDLVEYEMVAEYFRLGIQGYTTKSEDENELEQCVQTVLIGQKFVSCKGALGIVKGIAGNEVRMVRQRKKKTTERTSTFEYIG